MNNMRNKILSLLVLLLTAATGAWAQSLHSFYDLRNEIESGGNKILQYDYYKYESGDPIEISTSGVIDGNGAIIDMEGATISHVFNISADNVTIKNLSIINYTGTGDAIYFFGSGGSVYNIGYDVALNRVTTANTWTLSMPSGNVLLTPQYAAVAKWAVESAGTTDEKTLLPAAAEGVIAGTDAPLIAEGTGIVAFAGTSTEVTQGTVMYAVTAATATEAPALTSSDWKNTVPTAKNIADDGAEVKVWYYIQGADAPQGVAATLDNTFNNSDICATPLTVTVLSNKFDLTLKAANVNTIDATQASKGTVTVKVGTGAAVDKTSAITDEGKLEGIKMGSEVKLNAKQGYKFRKVEVKKKAAAKPLANATTEDLGKVVGADGNIYANKDAAEAVTTGNAVAMICYVNEGHGLALALSDISSHYHSWDNSGPLNEGKTAAELCSAWNTSKAVTGATWKLASLSEMNLMINAAGGYAALRDGFSAVGGTNMIDDYYWVSDESSADYAKNINFGGGYDMQEFKDNSYQVRACLEW